MVALFCALGLSIAILGIAGTVHSHSRKGSDHHQFGKHHDPELSAMVQDFRTTIRSHRGQFNRLRNEAAAILAADAFDNEAWDQIIDQMGQLGTEFTANMQAMAKTVGELDPESRQKLAHFTKSRHHHKFRGRHHRHNHDDHDHHHGSDDHES